MIDAFEIDIYFNCEDLFLLFVEEITELAKARSSLLAVAY